MSMHMAKAAVRQAKNLAKGFTDVQVKVREATSNDPWGPSGTQMAELADATYRQQEFQEIMDLLDKRLNDSGKNWRHVFKALTVLDYLIHCGSESVIAYAKQNLYVIKTLKEFQYIDEEGKDQGANVREKSKAIASLLADDERLKDERKARQSLRDRLGAGLGSRGPTDSFRPTEHRKSYTPSNAYEEEAQLDRAIEESKRTAAEHERRMREKEELEVKRAAELSKAQQVVLASAQQAPQQQIDLWGSMNEQQQQKQDFDFFATMAAPAPAQSNQPDPFGFTTPSGPFGAATVSTSYTSAATAQSFQQQSSLNAAMAQSTPAFSNFVGAPVAGSHTGAVGFPNQNLFSVPSALGQPAANESPFGAGPPSSGAAFDAAFDTGAGQKNFIPRGLQAQGNPNAQIAAIARNATQIDPFANLASGSGTGGASSGFAGGSDLYGAGQHAAASGSGLKSSMNDLFSASQATSNPWSGSAAPQIGATPAFMGMAPLAPTPANPLQQPTMNSASQFGAVMNSRAAPSDPFAALAPFPAKISSPPPSSGMRGQPSISSMAKQPSMSGGMGMSTPNPAGYGMMSAPLGQSSMSGFQASAAGMGGYGQPAQGGNPWGSNKPGMPTMQQQQSGYGMPMNNQQSQPAGNNNFFF